jgi:hypothetical protein
MEFPSKDNIRSFEDLECWKLAVIYVYLSPRRFIQFYPKSSNIV